MQARLCFFVGVVPGAESMSRVTLALVAAACGLPAGAAERPRPFVSPEGGRLVYAADSRGNRVPDFSHAGYGGGAAVPDVPVRVVVPPRPGDSGPRIQAALDQVAALRPGPDGFRGAVLLL